MGLPKKTNRIGRTRAHEQGTTAKTFYTTPPTLRTIEAWRVQYSFVRIGKRGKPLKPKMSRSEAFRQICELAAKKVERDRAREAL